MFENINILLITDIYMCISSPQTVRAIGDSGNIMFSFPWLYFLQTTQASISFRIIPNISKMGCIYNYLVSVFSLATFLEWKVIVKNR